jgi:hypothetical protein
MVNTMLAQRVEVGVGGVVPVEAKMGRPSSVWGMHGDKVAPTWGGGQLRRSGRNGTTAADVVVIGRLYLRARSMFETVVTVAMGRAQILFQSFSKFCFNLFPNIQIFTKICNSIQMPSRVPKILKLCIVLVLNMKNNFSHWPNLKFHLDHLL